MTVWYSTEIILQSVMVQLWAGMKAGAHNRQFILIPVGGSINQRFKKERSVSYTNVHHILKPRGVH